MTIVIDSWENEAVRTDDPVAQIRIWVKRQLDKGNDKMVGLEGETVDEKSFDWHFDNTSHETWMHSDWIISGFLMTEDEGSQGVAVGFSSSDRCPFAMPWPEALTEEDFIGNGDPMVYDTHGVADGVAVQGHEEILPEN